MRTISKLLLGLCLVTLPMVALGQNATSKFQSVEIEAGFQPIPDDLELFPGVPLRAQWGGRWYPVTVLESKSDGQLRIHWDDWSSAWDEVRDRSTLAIATKTLEELSEPDANKKFKDRSKVTSVRPIDRSQLYKHTIHIELPASAQRVNNNMRLKKGTRLKICFAAKWESVTVTEIYDQEDAVRIRWDGQTELTDLDVSRSCLIIENDVLKSLGEADDMPIFRKWKDSTGKHEINATFVKFESGMVHLQLEDGRKVELPIERLSVADQAYIEKIEDRKDD